MKHPWLIAAIVAGAFLMLLGWTFRAHADPMCFTWEVARDAVKQQFGEVPAFMSTLKIPSGEAVVTVTINPTTHSWSLIVQPTADKACIIMSGEGWSVAPEAVAHPPTAVPVVPQHWRDDKGWNYLIPIAQ